MAFEHPLYIRVILAVTLRCAFGVLTLLSFKHLVRSRPKLFHLGVLLTSGLGLASMWVPNVDKDWMYLTRTLFRLSYLLCVALLQWLILRWFVILQHHATQEIWLAALYAKFHKWNKVLLLGLALATLYDSTPIFILVALLLELLACMAWLDGSMFGRRGASSLPTRSIPSVRYATTDARLFPDATLFHMRWDSYSLQAPYDGSRVLFSKMTQSLVLATVMLCASSAAHLLFYAICSHYTKLCDLDFEYISFFFCHCIGLLPFLTMLIAPGFLPRFDTSKVVL